MQSSRSKKKLVKPLKITNFLAQLTQKRGQYGPRPENIFFAEITKGDYKLSKKF